jgi:hypothetical protein
MVIFGDSIKYSIKFTQYLATEGAMYMTLLSALRKLFTKHDRFENPRHYRLTSKEQEQVIVFFAIILMVAICGIFVFFL